MRNGDLEPNGPRVLKVTALIAAGTLAFAGALDFTFGSVDNLEYGSGQATHLLEQSGYSHPLLIDVDTLFAHAQGCGPDDDVGYKFAAEKPNGAEVRVMVCKGLHEAATVHQG